MGKQQGCSFCCPNVGKHIQLYTNPICIYLYTCLYILMYLALKPFALSDKFDLASNAEALGILLVDHFVSC